ncbi:MAG: RNA-binding S4 domain-containing protein [Clostridia bacterium]|jgi:ribosomal 50S subunit-recycling heat shock protein
MRIDKYLKVSRLIKRRTVANEACETGHIKINDKVAKPGTEIKVGDIIEMRFGANTTKVLVLTTQDNVSKNDAKSMYEIQ